MSKRCSGSASPGRRACPPTSSPPGTQRSKEVLADKAVHEKMLNVGVLPAYLNSADMKARVERDRTTVQKLFGG